MGLIITSVIVSGVTSTAITIWWAKKITTRYFEIANGYVSDMCEKTLQSNKKTEIIVHKLARNLCQEE